MTATKEDKFRLNAEISATLDAIEAKITGDRAAYTQETLKEHKHGFGLTAYKPVINNDEEEKVFAHYHIKSGVHESTEKAFIEFNKEYEKQGPYSDGEILWRMTPTLERDNDFDHSYSVCKVEARFSICKEEILKVVL